MKQFRLVTILMAGILSACGSRQVETSEAPQPVQTIQVGKPILLGLQDGKCQNGMDSFGELQLEFWDGYQLQPDRFDLSDWQSLDAFSSDLVELMIYGYSELTLLGKQCAERSRPSELMDPFCRNQRLVQSPGEALRICDRPQVYRQGSVEKAALTVAASLDRIIDFFTWVSGQYTLEPLSVLLFPNIQFQTNFEVRNEARISFSITDNAAWGRRGNSRQAESVLYIFPMSEEYVFSRRSFTAPSFWEVPWIMAHEFGHHIFYNVMGPKARRHFGYDFMTTNSAQELPFHYSWKNFQSSASPTEDHQLTALNEAFADLFAHYYRSGNSLEIAHLDCVFQQRDVANPNLNDGRQKSFRELARSVAANDPCTRVASNDVHVQGAVFAHFVAAMIDDSHLGPVDAIDWKGEIWFAHMQGFAKLLDAAVDQPDSIDIWPMAVQALIDVLRDRGFTMGRQQCSLIDQVFGRQFTGFQRMSRYLDLDC